MGKAPNFNADNPGVGAKWKGKLFQTPYGSVESECLKQGLDLIAEYLSKVSDGIFVELGVFGGVTELYLYDLCKKNNIQIYGIDPFDEIALFNGVSSENINDKLLKKAHNTSARRKRVLLDIIAKHNLDINIVQGLSHEKCTMFDDESIDILHIDGDHATQSVIKDASLYWPKLKKGGYMIFDDYRWGSVKRGIDAFLTDFNISPEQCTPRPDSRTTTDHRCKDCKFVIQK